MTLIMGKCYADKKLSPYPALKTFHNNFPAIFWKCSKHVLAIPKITQEQNRYGQNL